jgi:hypothetical protein
MMSPHRHDNRDPEPVEHSGPQGLAEEAMPPTSALPGTPGAPAGGGPAPPQASLPRSREAVTPATPVGSGYLQLRLRVEGGRLRIVDARHLPGQLVQPQDAGPGYAYEVTVGGRRVSLGSLPDLSVRRSYPNPHGPPEQQVHHVSPNPHPEFAVRLRSDEITRDELPSLAVALYEVPAHAARPPSTALLRDAGPAVRPLATLSPGWLDQMPPQTRLELERALRPGS